MRERPEIHAARLAAISSIPRRALSSSSLVASGIDRIENGVASRLGRPQHQECYHDPGCCQRMLCFHSLRLALKANSCVGNSGPWRCVTSPLTTLYTSARKNLNGTHPRPSHEHCTEATSPRPEHSQLALVEQGRSNSLYCVIGVGDDMTLLTRSGSAGLFTLAETLDRGKLHQIRIPRTWARRYRGHPEASPIPLLSRTLNSHH
ncbi:hypothetical protein BU16DRAFT_372164 [Lophium mytilinum]|uniref:Uncharacterized protein n=1 Tax=Lophium mytilinum TaxID=390894 RepID=A0A6A6QWN7_9PEZI|nr:hypothetical protein BU16DRAFT_372164 [Lophium mytilinum]